MDLKKLLGLRPKTDTAEAISNAIAMAEAERAAALTRITELEAGRGNLILTGDEQAMQAGERALASARAEAEQLGVMAAALKPQLAEAKTREKAAEIAEAAKTAEREVERFVTWWRTQYPGLADQMIAGARMEQQAVQAIAAVEKMQREYPAAFAASEVAIPLKPARQVRPSNYINSISDCVLHGLHLPSDDVETPLWPRAVLADAMGVTPPQSRTVIFG
jgi:hypothetical protein